MGRLKCAPARLGSAPSRIARSTDEDGHSIAAEPWRRWYKWAAWEALRQRVFVRDLCTCQCGCNTLIGDPRERIADHKDPEAKQSEARFFDDNEVQTLWKPHHDGWKQRLERSARAGRRPHPGGVSRT